MSGLHKSLFLLILFLIPYSNNYSQEFNLKTNYAVFDSLISKCIDDISDIIVINGKDKIYKCLINDNSDKKIFLETLLRQKLTNLPIVFGSENGSIEDTITINKLILNTSYPKIYTKGIFGNEFFDREIFVSFECNFSSKDFKLTKVLNFKKKYSGSVPQEYFDYIQGNDYSFMKSKLPVKTFFKKILIPAAAIVVSAAVITLFFTIRSK